MRQLEKQKKDNLPLTLLINQKYIPKYMQKDFEFVCIK